MESIGIYEKLGIFNTNAFFFRSISYASRIFFTELNKKGNLDQIETKELPIKYDSPLSV